MIKKYPWHFIFALFILISLANIYQKLKWSSVTDHLTWESTDHGLVCQSAPKDSQVKPGDIMLAVNKYLVSNKIDLQRSIAGRNYCRYEIERQGILKNVGVDIDPVFTPFSYYILVFVGILAILLTLGILNIYVKQATLFPPPQIFFILSLTLSGFLIFSPSGDYGSGRFPVHGAGHRLLHLLPGRAAAVHAAVPAAPPGVQEIQRQVPQPADLPAAVALLVINLYFILQNLFNPDPEILVTAINHFRSLSRKYFALYVILAWGSVVVSSLTLVTKKKQKRYIFPLAGISLSFIALLLLDFSRQAPEPAPASAST